MLIFEILIKALLITKFSDSLTIYQPNFGASKPKGLPDHNATFSNLRSKSRKGENVKITFLNSAPYQPGSISNTLSQTNSLNYKSPGQSNIFPVQYHNPLLATRPQVFPNANEQPVTAVSLESKILHEPTKGNYNNKIYHINTNKRASPLANNDRGEYTTFIVRKQRNLKENHDDKLIGQNIEDGKNVNEDDDDVDDRHYTAITAAAASLSSKQPLTITPETTTTTMTSHEIRYLHDIFLNFPKSHHVNAGHVELTPSLFEKRFESQKAGNRFKGEIMWLDKTGGFAQHSWDLAQGKL